MAKRRTRKTSRSSAESTQKSTEKTKRTRKRRTKRTWNPESYAEKLIEPVAQALGLDTLGFDHETLRELLKDIIIDAFGDVVSKPSPETIVKRLLRNNEKVLSIITSKILEKIPEGKLTPEQLEFVVMYIGPAALAWASRLYKEIMRTGLKGLLPNLQAAWEEGWRLKGDVGPVAYCPKCGFRSIAPDLSCMVCGYTLTENELKRSVNFERLLELTIKRLDCQTLRKLSERGIVYLSHTGIELERTSKWDIEIPLSRKEKEMIRKTFNERCENVEEKKLQEILSKALSS